MRKGLLLVGLVALGNGGNHKTVTAFVNVTIVSVEEGTVTPGQTVNVVARLQLGVLIGSK